LTCCFNRLAEDSISSLTLEIKEISNILTLLSLL
jgi:hypothetical protein